MYKRPVKNGSRTTLVALVLVGVAMAVVVVGGIWLFRRTPHAPNEQTATELAELAQSPDAVALAQSVDERVGAMHFAWLAPSARALRPIVVSLGRDHAHLSVSRDGPHYSVLREPADGTRWVFRKTYGNTAPVTLSTVVVPADRKLTRTQLIERIYGHLGADLRDAPDDDMGVHMARVRCALHLEPPLESRARARAQLVDSIARTPKFGALRVGLALVDAADKRETATEDLHRWAHEESSFARLSDLALLHWMRGAVDPAIAAAKEALGRSVTTERSQALNATSRIIPIVELAIQHRRYADAIGLINRIEKLEPEASTRQALALDLRALKAVATFSSGDRAAATALVTDGLEHRDAFFRVGNEPHRALAEAIRAGDESGVRAFVLNPGSGIVRGMFGNYDLVTALGLPSPQPLPR